MVDLTKKPDALINRCQSGSPRSIEITPEQALDPEWVLQQCARLVAEQEAWIASWGKRIQ